MASWLKATTRRLEQGILEQLGATHSSGGAGWDADAHRVRRVEDALGRMCVVVEGFTASLKKHAEEARDLASAIDSFAVADARHGVAGGHAHVSRLDAIQTSLRVHTHMRDCIAKSVDTFVTDKILAPAGALLRQLPPLKRLMDARRQCLTDYDAYVRRLENVRARTDRTLDELHKAENKVKVAAASLEAAKAKVATTITRLEEERAALVLQAAHVLAGAEVHYHRHASDILSSLLPLFPEAASTLAELAGLTHVVAAAARPITFGQAATGNSSSSRSLQDALRAPIGAALKMGAGGASEVERFPQEMLGGATSPFRKLHAEALGNGVAKSAVSTAAARAATVKSTAARMGVHVLATPSPGAHEPDAVRDRVAAVTAVRALSERPAVYARPSPSTHAPAAPAGTPSGARSAARTPAISRSSSASSMSHTVGEGASTASHHETTGGKVASLAAKFGGAAAGTTPDLTLRRQSSGPGAAHSGTPLTRHGSSSSAAGRPTGVIPRTSTAGDGVPMSARRSLGRGASLHQHESQSPEASVVSAQVAAVPAGRIARVVFDFTATADDEIDLQTGQLVEILERAADGWWQGRVLREKAHQAGARQLRTAASFRKPPEFYSDSEDDDSASDTDRAAEASCPMGLFPYNYVSVLSPAASRAAMAAAGLLAETAFEAHEETRALQRSASTSSHGPERASPLPPATSAHPTDRLRPPAAPPGPPAAVKPPPPPPAAAAGVRRPAALPPDTLTSEGDVLAGTESYPLGPSSAMDAALLDDSHLVDRGSSASSASAGRQAARRGTRGSKVQSTTLRGSMTTASAGDGYVDTSDDDSSFGGRRVVGLPVAHATGLPRLGPATGSVAGMGPELSLTALAAMGALDPRHQPPPAPAVHGASFLDASRFTHRSEPDVFQQSWDVERDGMRGTPSTDFTGSFNGLNMVAPSPAVPAELGRAPGTPKALGGARPAAISNASREARGSIAEGSGAWPADASPHSLVAASSVARRAGQPPGPPPGKPLVRRGSAAKLLDGAAAAFGFGGKSSGRNGSTTGPSPAADTRTDAGTPPAAAPSMVISLPVQVTSTAAGVAIDSPVVSTRSTPFAAALAKFQGPKAGPAVDMPASTGATRPARGSGTFSGALLPTVAETPRGPTGAGKRVIGGGPQQIPTHAAPK